MSSKSVTRKSPSRKSSSRSVSKSSSRSVSKSASRKMPMDTDNAVTSKGMIFWCIIILDVLILYYLHNLEDDDCVCAINWKTDWRHNYIKYFTITLICANILKLLSGFRNNIVSGILFILSLVNIYAFFTYVNDINTNKCVCATEKQKTLNWFMYLYAYLRVIFIILGIFMLIAFISMLANMRASIKK